MKREVPAVLFVALSVAVAGCAGSAKQTFIGKAPSSRVDLRITKPVPCLNGHQPLAGPAAVSRFHPVTAVECGVRTRIYPGSGQWKVFVRKVAVSRVSGLQRYFEQRSETNLPKLPAHAMCVMAAQGLVNIPVFVDAQGHWLVPKTPVDRCGAPLGMPKGVSPTRPVRWRVVSVRKIELLVSAPALAAGCAMKWGRPGPVSHPSGPIFVLQPQTVHVCIYRTSARHPWGGDFVRGFRLDSSRTARLLSALNGAVPRAGCPRQTSFAEVIGAPGTTVSLELGGCYRVDGTRTAKAAVIRAILGSG